MFHCADPNPAESDDDPRDNPFWSYMLAVKGPQQDTLLRVVTLRNGADIT